MTVTDYNLMVIVGGVLLLGSINIPIQSVKLIRIQSLSLVLSITILFVGVFRLFQEILNTKIMPFFSFCLIAGIYLLLMLFIARRLYRTFKIKAS